MAGVLVAVGVVACSPGDREAVPIRVEEEVWAWDVGHRAEILDTAEVAATLIPLPDIAVLTLEIDGLDQRLVLDHLSVAGRTRRMEVEVPDGHRVVAGWVSTDAEEPFVLALTQVGGEDVLNRWDVGERQPTRVDAGLSLPGGLVPVDVGGHGDDRVVVVGEDEEGDETVFTCEIEQGSVDCREDDGLPMGSGEVTLGRVTQADGEMVWLTRDGTRLRRWTPGSTGRWVADELELADELTYPDLGGTRFERINRVSILPLTEDRVLLALAAETDAGEELVVGTLVLGEELSWEGHATLSVDPLDTIEWIQTILRQTSDGEGVILVYEKRALTEPPILHRVEPFFPKVGGLAEVDASTFSSMTFTELTPTPVQWCTGPASLLQELSEWGTLLTTCTSGDLTMWGAFREGAIDDEAAFGGLREGLSESGLDPLVPDFASVAVADDGVWVPDSDNSGRAHRYLVGSDVPAAEYAPSRTASGVPFTAAVDDTGVLHLRGDEGEGPYRPVAVGATSAGVAHHVISVDDWVFELPTVGSDRPGWWARLRGRRPWMVEAATLPAPAAAVCVRNAMAAVVTVPVDDEVEIRTTTSGGGTQRSEVVTGAPVDDGIRGCLIDDEGGIRLLDGDLRLRAVGEDGEPGPAHDIGLDDRCTGFVALRALPDGGSVVLWEDRCDDDDRLRLARLDPGRGRGPSRLVGAHLAASDEVKVTWAGCAFAVVSRGQVARIEMEREECSHA